MTRRPLATPVVELELDERPSLAFLEDTLERFAPPNRHQEETRDRMLAFLAAHPEDAHRRTCLPGHFTASALVVDREASRVLLTFHRKLQRWLQFGGHCDGDANVLGTAWRETVEESGIEPIAMTPEPVDVDIHRIPARPGEPEHDHLDVRFLAYVAADARPVISEESIELGWFTPDEARGLDIDASVRRLLDIEFTRS